MKKFVIKTKEVGRPHPVVTTYECSDETTEEFVVEFFGLKDKDVESYEIEEQLINK